MEKTMDMEQREEVVSYNRFCQSNYGLYPYF